MTSKKTLAEKTAEAIKAMIQKDHYEPGQKLPTEKELCEMLNVGRNTLREAERILQSHSIVTIRQGSGTYISEKYGVADDPFGFDMYPDHNRLTSDILEVLVFMEPEIVEIAAEKRDQHDIERMEDCLNLMAQKVDQGLSCIDEECEFYRLIADSSHNIVMERMTPLLTQGIRFFASTLQQKDFLYAVRNYRQVLSGIKHQKAVDAKLTMSYHLLFLRRQYIELLQRAGIDY